ncbi:hypothetical protein VTK73DRAFT_4721 [Phialemonium thermophilum]|uniref:FAD/NAD(P)-binding domain-containing protein n=1 Tax=Phialemonium thermophilum TaxID=223376 RepID=A0ABR3V6G9_9PEZI
MSKEAESNKAKKQLVILGGSFAGVSAAHYLLRHAIPQLPDPSSYQIVLVSSSSEGFCRPASPRAALSDDFLPQDKLFVNIPAQFARYPKGSFRFVHGTAVDLDISSRSVTVRPAGASDNDGATPLELSFYALVIATGAEAASPLLGLTKSNDADALRANWAAFRKVLPSAKEIVIAGGGPAGVELAGELGEYLNGRRGFFSCGQSDPKVSITLVSATSRILPALRPSIGQQAEKYLGDLGVRVVKNTRAVPKTQQGQGQSSASSGVHEEVTSKTTVVLTPDADKPGSGTRSEVIEADLFIPCVGTTPNTWFVRDKSLLASDGRVETNPETLRVDKAGPGARIYALGDASTFVAQPSIYHLQMAVPFLCANIKRDLLLAAGAQPAPAADRLFKADAREAGLVPIGRSKGVGAVMGYKLPSFLVWLFKGRDYFVSMLAPVWTGEKWAKEA